MTFTSTETELDIPVLLDVTTMYPAALSDTTAPLTLIRAAQLAAVSQSSERVMACGVPSSTVTTMVSPAFAISEKSTKVNVPGVPAAW
jgi:hypothetical protein